MRMIFAVFGLLLLLTGSILLLVPRQEPVAPTRGAPSLQQAITWYGQARNIADQVNGPLSIVFGLISLYYSRKRYIVERDNHDGKSG